MLRTKRDRSKHETRRNTGLENRQILSQNEKKRSTCQVTNKKNCTGHVISLIVKGSLEDRNKIFYKSQLRKGHR